MTCRHLLFLLCAVLPALPAAASSPDAWDEHYRDVVRDCLKATRLKHARPEGSLMVFSNRVGIALLLRGSDGKKKDVQQLCIRGRGDSAAEIQPVEGVLDPNRYR
jgi:hypothetical protein